MLSSRLTRLRPFLSRTRSQACVPIIEMSQEAPAKRPVGRPTKYKPEFCEQIIELGKEGKSIAQMASFFDVDKASIYDWAAQHEDFSTALARAKAHSQTWWEDKAQVHLGSRDFNAQLWLKSVASRFRDDYTERTQTEVSGRDGAPMQIETTAKVDTRSLDAEQREALKLALQSAIESDVK